MSDGVHYERSGEVATITMDDGKANALSLAMFDELATAFDRAEADGAVVVLAGRDGRFSGGFDLGVLQSGQADAVKMLLAGFELAHRLRAFPRPIVAACTGHAYAMGAFLLLSCDHRIGVAGAAHRFTANEVLIGLTMPNAALEVCRTRLTPSAFPRVMELAEIVTTANAVETGFLDELVPAADLLDRAGAKANELTALNWAAYVATKERSRAQAQAALRAAIDADTADWHALFG